MIGKMPKKFSKRTVFPNSMDLKKFYVYPAFSKQKLNALKLQLKKCSENLQEIDVEVCFYVAFSTKNEISKFDDEKREKVLWFLGRSIEDARLECTESSFFHIQSSKTKILLEFGPRLNFTTAFSTNATSSFKAAGIHDVERIERSWRYSLSFSSELSEEIVDKISNLLHDRMTECRYFKPLCNFDLHIKSTQHFEIDILARGKSAIIEANEKSGLALDLQDIDMYYDIFVNKAKRNPTNVELFDLAQSNSEHSRHWFFKGRLFVDGVESESSLLDMVINTQTTSNCNNVIKFSDNSSGIIGDKVEIMKPKDPLTASSFQRENMLRHIIYTAETHNFPTGVCPFPGAATGTGGRIRDVQAAGRGGHVVAGIAGYSFGNLHINDYLQQWENSDFHYPATFARPLEICIQASNGASDYGNKFGEPVICGFARSFGQLIKYSNSNQEGERVEYVKPIMFSGGIGTIDDSMLSKNPPAKEMLVVKLGGPVYRIGVGGGSASSVEVQGEKHRNENLDFGAVQRGDAEMEQKLNRVIRGCLEMSSNRNPIQSIHDQGAGGNGNVLKEIVEGSGARIFCDRFELGDPTLNVLELWGAEYQESNAILIKPEDKDNMQILAQRERCPTCFVGSVTGDNKIVLVDFEHSDQAETKIGRHPVDLDLDWVLGSMPRKVDRSVTGLIAQQQCVGPLHVPLADVAVTALSYFDTVGSAVAVGEQPIKMLINPEAGARMTVGEALTNLVFAPISDLRDVKCSANWMWPAKLPGEGARLLAACQAMCNVMSELGVAVDGGKDSLSMAARVEDKIIKSPGTLVISAYARCTDITKIVTPDLKCSNNIEGQLLYVCFGGAFPSCHRLGGSALAQCYCSVGESRDSSDLLDANVFKSAFNIVQELIKGGFIKSGHDVSDGGLLCCILEMAFAGNCGLDVKLDEADEDHMTLLFGEGLGLVIEIDQQDLCSIYKRFRDSGVFCISIGRSLPQYGSEARAKICIGERMLLDESVTYLRNVWEETSYRLELLQCNPICVEQERNFLQTYIRPPFKLGENLSLDLIGDMKFLNNSRPTVGIVREEGSNGDREMAVSFMEAGFETWDVCMQDFLNQSITVDRFDGLAFVGGFSYADVFGAAKGWASAIEFNENLKRQFDWFRRNERKFSFGVCNGCQLMALLGWVGQTENNSKNSKPVVILDTNVSERFESRFSCVRIDDSPSVMLKNMAGSVLGVWVAHGEGKFAFDNENRMVQLLSRNLAPIFYVDQSGEPTEMYPENPNGSPRGIAALCSQDGRHLAVMPHPERCFLKWQWPYWPENFRQTNFRSNDNAHSPWFLMFKNALSFCLSLKNC